MKKLNVSEMRKVEGGKKMTIYTCRCGYTCTSRAACVWHMATKHFDVVGQTWAALFSIAVAFV